MFVTKIWKEYPDLTLLLLEDGRVIGVDGESVVVYKDINDVFEGVTMDRPTLTLYKGE
jgi:hypothetical protein